jgi:hypothetical protein
VRLEDDGREGVGSTLHPRTTERTAEREDRRAGDAADADA